MDGLILIGLALVVGPGALTYALRKTPVFWLPSAALLLIGRPPAVELPSAVVVRDAPRR